jgi:hypothetical protein
MLRPNCELPRIHLQHIAYYCTVDPISHDLHRQIINSRLISPRHISSDIPPPAFAALPFGLVYFNTPLKYPFQTVIFQSIYTSLAWRTYFSVFTADGSNFHDVMSLVSPHFDLI